MTTQKILTLSRKLNERDHYLIKKSGVSIHYESRYLPLIGVSFTDIDQLSTMDFVSESHYVDTLNFSELSFQTTAIFCPGLPKRHLVNNQLVGFGGVKVAVLDSGVNFAVDETTDFTGYGMTDVRDHGTKVVEIIKTYAPRAHVLVAKVGHTASTDLDIMRGIEWAIDRGANIINISAGQMRGCQGTCNMAKLINKVTVAENVMIVVSAGNAGPNIGSIGCPGCAEHAITVGAIAPNGTVADYSGRGFPGSIKPNILAPGKIYLENNREDEGTSFSAPAITGILAASLSNVGTNGKVIEYLYNTAQCLGLEKHVQGFGMVDLKKFVEVIGNGKTIDNSTGQGQS